MADNPIFPEDENLDNAREYRSIQKDIGVYLKNQVEFLKEKASLSRSVQEQLEAQNKKDKAHVLDIQKQMGTLYGLIEQRIKVEGTEADALEHQIKSVRNEVKLYRDLVALSQDRMALAIQADKEQQAESFKWVNIVKNGLQEITGLDVKEFTLVKKISDEILSHGIESKALAYSIGAIVMMLKGAFDLFKKMDAAAWDFRKAMGMTRMESAVIRKDAERLAIDYMAMGVTIDQVYKSYQAIGQTVGGVHNVTKDMARDVSLMASQFGISEETSAEFMRNLAAVSHSTLESQQNMMGLAQSISSAAGVNLGQVMQDVGTKSEKTLTLMSRMPNTVLRTAIELRHMGTSMDAAANAGAHILDFTQSMNEEMEASVLLGKSVSFQQVRQLTYARDLQGAAKKTVDLAEQNGFLHKMDYYQMQAFAKLSGYTVDQLTQMVQTREQMEKIRLNGTSQQKAELAAYEKMRKENEATTKLRAKDAMVQIRTMANQQRIIQIQNKWNEILARAEQWLLPIIDDLLAMVIPAMDIAQGIFAWTGAIKLFAAPLTLVANIISNKITAALINVARYGAGSVTMVEKFFLGINQVGMAVSRLWKMISSGFGLFNEITRVMMVAARYGTSGFTMIEKFFLVLSKIGGWFGKILSPIAKIFGIFGKFGGFIGMFAKWIPILGWVIMAFQFIGNLFSRLKGIGDAFNKGFFNGLWFGLKAIVGALYDTLIKPFVDAFKWIWHFFGGNSPSLLGMGIVNGIVSIGTMLFKAITLPWRLAFSVITHLAPMVGKLIWKGIVGYFHMWTTLGHVVFNGAKHLGDMIFNGLKSIKDKIIDVLQHPFRSAWSGIKKLWGGHSPSQLGLSILTGIQSVGGMMHEALTSPFHNGIKDIMKKMGEVKKHAIISQPSSSVEARIKAAYIPAVTVSPSGTKIETSSTPKPAAAKGKDKSSATLDDVLDALNTQNKLLEKILAKDPNIKMDGQLLSTSLARQTAFHGGYGVNKI